jgi:hypothetical protein
MNIPAIVVGVLSLILVSLIIYAVIQKNPPAKSSKSMLDNTINAITGRNVVENYESALIARIKASNYKNVAKAINPILLKYTTEEDRTLCGATTTDLETMLKNTLNSITVSIVNIGEINNTDKYNDFCALFLSFVYLLMIAVRGDPPAYSTITSSDGTIEAIKITSTDMFSNMITPYVTIKDPSVIPSNLQLYYNRSKIGVEKIIVDYKLLSASELDNIIKGTASIDRDSFVSKIRQHKEYILPYSLFCDMIVTTQQPQMYNSFKKEPKGSKDLCLAKF